jgi:formylglycine-generating enzyme required for sulfatase activity
LARLTRSEIGKNLLTQAGLANSEFRFPSETEWEYAARGGPQWRDGFQFSGGNDIELLAWHDRKAGDHTQDVAQKAPNQLGLFDMSGNVWEWCQDMYTADVSAIPRDGSPRQGDAPERVLRGGCFHNWAIHCTVSKRYQIERQFHDGCIGFRPVFGVK